MWGQLHHCLFWLFLPISYSAPCCVWGAADATPAPSPGPFCCGFLQLPLHSHPATPLVQDLPSSSFIFSLENVF